MAEHRPESLDRQRDDVVRTSAAEHYVDPARGIDRSAADERRLEERGAGYGRTAGAGPVIESYEAKLRRERWRHRDNGDSTDAVTNLATVAAAGVLGYLAARLLSRPHEEEAYDPPGRRSGRPFIGTDRVEGTAVYGRGDERLGTITRLMLDKVSGRVAFAVLSTGGILGIGSEERAIGWDHLDYRPELAAYRTRLSPDDLRELPSVSDFEERQRRNSPGRGSSETTYYWIIAG